MSKNRRPTFTLTCKNCGEKFNNYETRGAQRKYCKPCSKIVRRRQNRITVRKNAAKKRLAKKLSVLSLVADGLIRMDEKLEEQILQ
jgi:hypothetical protein